MTACMLVFFWIMINLTALAAFMIINSQKKYGEFLNDSIKKSELQEASDALKENEAGSFEMGEEALHVLEESGCAFSFLLDEGGKVVWEWKKPGEVPDRFSAGDIAAFSKWYLEGYPVSVWRHGEGGLLVAAYPKGSRVRYNGIYSKERLDAMIEYIGIFVLLNVILVFLLALLFGYRFYRSLKPVGKGIEALSEGKPVRLREKGMTRFLKEKINLASRLLEKQREELERRDTARTEWIAGVSHDIRTPLSLIVGYADEMETDHSLPEKTRQQAGMIQSQSFYIKKLIEDLNLTSKLTYDMQPLRREDYVPAGLLRQTAAGMLNSGEITEKHELELDLEPALEQLHLTGDIQLLSRAVQNLLGNSVRHNPEGCYIRLTARTTEEGFCFCVRDDGPGIPDEVRRIVREDDRDPASDRRPHVMGLLVVKQIARAHGGSLWFSEDGKEVWMSVNGQTGSEGQETEKKKKGLYFFGKNG